MPFVDPIIALHDLDLAERIAETDRLLSEALNKAVAANLDRLMLSPRLAGEPSSANYSTYHGA